MKDGALYNLSAEERTRLDAAVFDLVNGCCLLLFPGESSVLSLNVGTEEKRSISSPSNETVLKGLPGRLCGEPAHQYQHRPPPPEGP